MLAGDGLTITVDADLRQRNSFGVRASSRLLAQATSPDGVVAALARAELEQLPVIVLGGGSNVLLVSDLDAMVLSPQLFGIEWLGTHAGRRHVRVGAGESWHGLVTRSIACAAYGLENLALIPGTVGAAPIQNIGAYGVELERFVFAVEVYDRELGQRLRLNREQCEFAYRDSLFKRNQGDRYLVLAVEFALLEEPQLVRGYVGVDEELARTGVLEPTPQDVCDAVCAIRRRKLPDPAKIGNAGSFFKNPMVPEAQAEALRERHPELPIYRAAGGARKLAAAWMIEQCGWRGHRSGDAGVHSEHALVLVNHGGASGREILDLAHAIQGSVGERFGVHLDPEPRVLGI